MTTEITAGPAADAKIAEATGWTQFGPCTGLHWKNAAGEVVRDGTALGFTTTGDGMLEMLEWMEAGPRWWRVVRYATSPEVRFCEVYASDLVTKLGSNGAWGSPTYPLAVAKALLAAVEEADE